MMNVKEQIYPVFGLDYLKAIQGTCFKVKGAYKRALVSFKLSFRKRDDRYLRSDIIGANLNKLTAAHLYMCVETAAFTASASLSASISVNAMQTGILYEISAARFIVS